MCRLELQQAREELRTANAMVAELEERNKKLNEQAHRDRKTIISVNEVSECVCVCVCVLVYVHVYMSWPPRRSTLYPLNLDF